MVDPDYEVVLRAWDAFSRVDLDGMLGELHPQVVAVPFGAALEGRFYHGIDQVRVWWRDEILATYDFFRVLVHGFERVGNRLLVTGRWYARGIESGVELDTPASWIIFVREGKISYWRTYTEHDQALRDMGLETKLPSHGGPLRGDDSRGEADRGGLRLPRRRHQRPQVQPAGTGDRAGR
jgi:ketosteroid isomerase-like protein